MKLLLDTHVLLWWLADNPRLSDQARKTIADSESIVFVSAVSIWEIVIKKGLGKLEIADDWYSMVSEEPFGQLPLTWEHANKVYELPELHRDPFDRMLIAQAMVEKLVLVTHDEDILRYNISILET